MKDSYSFDIDAAGLDKSFDLHDEVYRKIFTRCGLKFVAVEADSGAMGGSQSQEFMVYTDAGEDLIASCPVCHYAANLEKATSRLDAVTEMTPTGDGKPELVHTPGCAAISDVAEFFKISPASDIKCVAYMARKLSPDGKDTWHGVATFLRGDHQVNETKLLGAIGGAELRTMQAEELTQFFAGPAGFLGPVGLKHGSKPLSDELTVVVDRSLEGRNNLVAGANKLDYHLRNVTPGRDFTWTMLADIRSVNEGEACPKPGCAGATRRRQNRRNRPHLQARLQVLGVYGRPRPRRKRQRGHAHHGQLRHRHRANPHLRNRAIQRQKRLLAPRLHRPLRCRRHHHKRHRCCAFEAGEKIAAELEAAGVDVSLDDRDERAGVKFKDADLVGIPYRINVGKKTAEGKVELVSRATSTSEDVAIASIAGRVKALVSAENTAALKTRKSFAYSRKDFL